MEFKIIQKVVQMPLFATLQTEFWNLRKSLQNKLTKIDTFRTFYAKLNALVLVDSSANLSIKNTLAATSKGVNDGIFITEFPEIHQISTNTSENSRISEAKIYTWIVKGVFMKK